MPKEKEGASVATELIKTWELPLSATLGSSVRAKGILQDIRARLPITVRKALTLDSKTLILTASYNLRTTFRAAITIVDEALKNIAVLPIIPREIEDILVITSTERRRWLNDGRLPSAGTRTVRLRGRAKKITFHVFDIELIEDILDRDMVMIWREEDLVTASENRRRAAMKAKLLRATKIKKASALNSEANIAEPKLQGWDEFNLDGFLK